MNGVRQSCNVDHRISSKALANSDFAHAGTDRWHWLPVARIKTLLNLVQLLASFVDVNLDAIIEVRRIPEDNVTLLRSAYLPEYRIAVREEPDEIYSKPSLEDCLRRSREQASPTKCGKNMGDECWANDIGVSDLIAKGRMPLGGAATSCRSKSYEGRRRDFGKLDYRQFGSPIEPICRPDLD